jgi:hypothetical protein
MRKQIKLSLLPYLLLLTVVFGAIIGWVLNIVAIFHADFSHITGALALRIIGVFVAPLGAVMGWL